MRKTLAFALICVCTLVFCSCGFFGKEDENASDANGEDTAAEAGGETVNGQNPGYRRIVTVILPNEREGKWRKSAEAIINSLEKMRYGADVHYSEDAAEQAEIINEAVYNMADCVIIAAADSYSPEIRHAVESAAEAGIPVIAYDRLIMDTEGVDFYIAFDPYLSGRLCAQAIEHALNLSGETKNIGIVLPERENGSRKYFYHGVMDVLQPLEDSRLVSCAFDDEWSRFLKDGSLDAVLTVNDANALNAIAEIERNGYSGQFPYVTGAGCDLDNIHKILDGKQLISLFCDERVIADKIAETADLLMFDKLPAVYDKTTFNNGSKIVPAALIEPIPVDINNYKELLIGGDYYNYREINE